MNTATIHEEEQEARIKSVKKQLLQNKQQAWAVLWSKKRVERMVATDNHKIFKPFALFKTRTEALQYRNEKWHDSEMIEVKRVFISL